MTMLPLEEESLTAMVLRTHSWVPRTAQITTKAPKLVKKLAKNINVFFVVGIFPGGSRKISLGYFWALSAEVQILETKANTLL